MDTVYFRTLIETVESGSITEAAEKLSVTSSAVSQRIKHLENLYGCVLLNRSGSALKPTEAGRLVLDKAAAILAIEKEIAVALQGIGEKRSISFCCTPGFGIAFIPAILKNYTLLDAKSDDLNIFVGTPDDVARRLKERTADIAVVEHETILPVRGYEEFPLPDEELVFVSSPGIDIDDEAASLEELTPYRLFARVEECWSSVCLEENLQRLGTGAGRFKSITKLDDLHLIIHAVEDGAGVAYLSKHVVEKQLKEGTLRAHYVDGFVHRFRRALIVREGFRTNCRCASFAKAILSVFDLDEQGV